MSSTGTATGPDAPRPSAGPAPGASDGPAAPADQAPVDPAVLHGRVLAWYAAHARDLPWREPGAGAWGVLVSEVMLQQTPVVRVLPVWRAWMQRWPTPGDLAAQAPGEAVRAWDRLGYPRRALRLHAAACAVVERHGGAVPDDHEALLALPGVGAYTAAAVASFAFGRRHAVVDTNVRRVFARAVTGASRPAPSLTVAETALAESLLPDDAPTAARWGVGVMELGALVCTARAPRCDDCPLADLCRWQGLGRPDDGAPAPRGQAWQGTDRQMRGAIVAELRAAPGPVPTPTLLAAVARALPGREAQAHRCLGWLAKDGLLVVRADGTVALP